MRPLRDLIPRALPPHEPGPVQPIALLSANGRLAPDFDAGAVFDRSLFGLTEEEVRELGPVLPHVCEVAYEALERARLRFDRLRSMRMATYLGVSDPQWVTVRDAGFLAELLGLPGPASIVMESGLGLLVAAHHACEALRAGDADVALVAGDAGRGAAAIVLARPDAPDVGPARALVHASAVCRMSDEYSARAVAAGRAGVEERSLLVAREGGITGLVSAVTAFAGGDARPLAIADASDGVEVLLICGPAPARPRATAPPRLFGLAARTNAALRSLAADAASRMESDADLYALATDAMSRPPLEHRLSIPIPAGGAPADRVRERLQAWMANGVGAASGYAVEASVAFVIPPAGAQFAGMTAGLYAAEPVYREALDRMDRAATGLPRPLLEVLFASDGVDGALNDPLYANPVTFSVAYALSELLRSRGVVPGAVVGCGVGELAAAAIAGAVDPEDAVRVAVERGRLLGTLVQEAGRAVFAASEADVRRWIAGRTDVDVMALPAPDRVVVGGSTAGVAQAIEAATGEGVRWRRMAGFPNNTPLVEPILPDFVRVASGLRFRSPEIGWVSAATARRTEHADGGWWASTLRAPLRFSPAVETLYALGCRAFVELSRPALLTAGQRTLRAPALQPCWWFAALSPPSGVDRVGSDPEHVDDVLSALWVLGAPVERGAAPGADAVPVESKAELATYPWDRRALDQADEQRRVATLVYDAPRYEGAWHFLPDLDEPDSGPLFELGDGRMTPLTAPATAAPTTIPPVSELVEPRITPAPPLASVGFERSSTLVPLEEREEFPGDSLEGLPPVVVVDPPRPGYITPLPVSEEEWERAAMTPGGSQGQRATPPSEERAPAVPVSNRAPSNPPAADPSPVPEAVEAVPETVEVVSTPTPAPAPRAKTPTPAPEAPEDAVDRQVTWEEAWGEAPIDERSPLAPATWLVLTDREGVGDYLSALLASAGHRVVRAIVDTRARPDDVLTVADPATAEGWRPALQRLGPSGELHVLHLWSLEPPDAALVGRISALGPTELAAASEWARLMALTAALDAMAVPAKLHVVTRGGLRPPDRVTALTAGSLWGLARLLAVERPDRFGSIVELDPDDEDLDLLVKHLLAGDAGERAEYVFRSGQRWRRTVERVNRMPFASAVDVDGTWVLGGDIDGGAIDLASELVSRGVRRLFFVSADAPDPEILRGVLELQRKGIACVVVRADPTDERDVSQVGARIAREPRVSGVVQRLALRRRALAELDLPDATARWRQALGMTSLLWSFAGVGQRWVWTEGCSLRGVSGAQVSGVAGEAIAAMTRIAPAPSGRGVMSVLHTPPVGDMDPGRVVRLVLRLGPAGGARGVWE